MINRDFLNRMDAGMMPLRVGNSFLCLFVAVMSSVVHTSISLPHYGEGVFFYIAIYIFITKQEHYVVFYHISAVF